MKVEDSDQCVKFLHPFTMNVSGTTMSGKTEFVKKLVIHSKNLIIPPPGRIVVSYVENQPAYEELQAKIPNLTLVKNLDFSLDDQETKENTLLIIDDQMDDVVSSEKCKNLFTRGVHHKSISVITLQQNIFPQGKYGRTARLNTHYHVVMKSPTFPLQVSVLGRQLFPKHPQFLADAYKKATEKPYSYLAINLHPLCQDELRVFQDIFDGETPTVFIPR